jgi:hypothetical protein
MRHAVARMEAMPNGIKTHTIRPVYQKDKTGVPKESVEHEATPP